jgi:hypothetical protein
MNLNLIYHPLPRGMIVKQKARNKPEKGGTRRSRDVDVVPGSTKKPRLDTKQI